MRAREPSPAPPARTRLVRTHPVDSAIRHAACNGRRGSLAVVALVVNAEKETKGVILALAIVHANVHAPLSFPCASSSLAWCLFLPWPPIAVVWPRTFQRPCGALPTTAAVAGWETPHGGSAPPRPTMMTTSRTMGVSSFIMKAIFIKPPPPSSSIITALDNKKSPAISSSSPSSTSRATAAQQQHARSDHTSVACSSRSGGSNFRTVANRSALQRKKEGGRVYNVAMQIKSKETL